MQIKKKSLCFILLFLLIAISSEATQLIGSYTINPAATATATNFRNFFSANAYLTGGTRTDGGPNNSSPFGVAGPVVFYVSAGTYSEQFNLTVPITGVSPINTITYDGGNGNALSRIITYSGTFSSSSTVNINNNPYVTLRNLSINGTGSSFASGVDISGTSNCFRISKCNINLPIISSSSLNFYGIVVGSNRVDSLLIDSNIVNGGKYGIFLYPGPTIISYQNKIINNQVLNSSYGTAIVANYQSGISILNNSITPNTINPSIGINCNNSTNNGANSNIISGNKINNFAGVGLSVTGNNAISNKGLITNNMIGAGIKSNTAYGINISGTYWNVASNSINYDTISSLNSYCALYVNSGTGISVMNNIFSVKKAGNPALPIYVSNPVFVDFMDFNAFYREDTSDHVLMYIGGNYNSGNYKGANGFNTHSIFVNPGFVNDTNLHITLPCLQGSSLSYVTDDIDGEARNSLPNIGADEVTRAGVDMSATAMLAPVFPIVTGTQNLRVRVVNYGINTIFSFNISYKLNGNAPVTQSWSGILNPCDTVSILFSGAQQITIPSGSNTLKIYTGNPNFAIDGNLQNDTITTSFISAMGGTYTIGAAPSNYLTFASAIADMNLYGIGSAVRFLVKSGTYHENLNVTPVSGASLTNSIGFYSMAAHPDSVIVYETGVHVLQLSGSYFSFNYITFNQPSISSAGALFFMGTPAYDTLYNCKFIAPVAGWTSLSTIYANGATIISLVFRKNIVQGGYSGLNITSSSSAYSDNCIMDSNTIQNAYSSNLLRFFTNLKFRNNTVNLNASYSSNIFSITNCTSGYEFSGNHVNLSAGGATMYLTYYCAGTTGNRIKMNNNIFTASPGSSINVFAPYYYAGYVDFYNNTMALGNGYLQMGYNSNDIRCYNNSISSNNASYSFYQNESGNSNIDVKNNAISNINGGVAVYWNNTPAGTVYDYNNLYTLGSSLVSINAGAISYSTLGAWRGAYGQDKNSLSYRPGFINVANNLTPNISDSACWSLNGRGMPQSFITSDINGNSRSSQVLTGATDIGAFEFTPSVNPPLASASPATPVVSSTQYFSFGSDTIAAIIWGAGVPSSITAQLFSGTNPPQVGSGVNYMNSYWNITAPSGSYNYNLKLYYKPNWIGSVPSLSNMVIGKKSTGVNWGIASASNSIDLVNNIMTSNGLTNFSYFTGTDATTPLPVELIIFTAQKTDNDVVLNWSTVSELNNDYFEIERSLVTGHWTMVGRVKGNGTTNSISKYQFKDEMLKEVSLLDFARLPELQRRQARSDKVSTPLNLTYYYRLKQVDFDGTSSYSDVRVVNWSEEKNDWSISPNPGSDKIFVNGEIQNRIFMLYDLHGRELAKANEEELGRGIDVSLLPSGIYFYKITDKLSGGNKTGKWIKQ